MDEEARQKKALQNEMNLREMERKSLDVIRVYNPLDIKFTFKYDGYTHSISAKSEKDFPRYLASHYFKKISDYMIGLQVTKTGDELKALREKQLGKSFLDKYEENIEIWNRTPRMDDPDLVKQIKDTVIVGLVEEYGYDEAPEPEESIKKVDFRSMHDQIFAEEEKRVSESTPSAPKKPLKSKLVEEITNE